MDMLVGLSDWRPWSNQGMGLAASARALASWNLPFLTPKPPPKEKS